MSLYYPGGRPSVSCKRGMCRFVEVGKNQRKATAKHISNPNIMQTPRECKRGESMWVASSTVFVASANRARGSWSTDLRLLESR